MVFSHVILFVSADNMFLPNKIWPIVFSYKYSTFLECIRIGVLLTIDIC